LLALVYGNAQKKMVSIDDYGAIGNSTKVVHSVLNS